MEPLQPRQLRPIDRRTALAGLALAAFAPLGCLGVGRPFGKKEQDAPTPVASAPHGQLVTLWDKKVVYAGDPNRGGSLYPGLIGRIYLFGPDVKFPYIGDGSLIMDLYDCTPRGTNADPIQTDQFRVPADVVKQFAKKDVMGDGYTIFFPWAGYRPDITQASVNVLYTSAAGERFFSQSGTFAIDHTATTERVRKGMNVTNAATARQ